jgi:hypothetical protein
MMETKSNQLQRYTWRGTCVALLSVLTIFVFAGAANAVAQTSIILSQVTTYGPFPGGGAISGEDPAGGSMAVNSAGVVVAGDTYGGGILEFAPPLYAATVISPDTKANVGAVAIDSSGFLYVADQYNSNIIKVPMNANGTYTITVNTEDSVSSLPACLGDTKGDATVPECLISNPGTALGAFGVSSMTFSSSGALFFATDDQGDTGGVGPAYTIYECNTLCLYGTTAPVLIYAEPVQAAGLVAQDGQYYIGGLALDAWGNLFFTDSAETNGSLASADSRLNELPVVTKAINATLFAAAPIPILTLTNTPAASAPYYGNYDNSIDAVATDSNGHLYVSVIYNGIYGLVDNGSLNGSSTGAATVAGSSLYGIANQEQAKLLATDGHGNFYVTGNNGSNGTLDFISTGPVKFPGAETVGTAETASVVVADNTEKCTPTLTFTSPDTAFTGVITTGGTCNNMYQVSGSFTPVTLTYTPTATGFVASTLTIEDTGSSTSSAPQAVSSSGAAITISQGTYGAALPGGGAWGGSSPDGHTGAINTKGVLVFGDSYGNQITEYTNVAGVTTLFGGTTTLPGVAGAFNGGGGVAIDKSNNLFMSGEYGTTIYKVAPNSDGSYGPWTATSGNSPLNSAGNAPVACVGGAADVTAGICSINLGAGNYNFGIAGMAVDTNGNLFFTSDNQAVNSPETGAYAPDTVFECNLTCLYGASAGGIVAIYTEPTAAAASPQLIPGSIALDSSDNVYFTDSDISAIGSEYSIYSDVYELPVSSSGSTGYANNPTLLTKLTPACAALAGCNYNDAISTVSADASGDVFFGSAYDGVYEFVKSSGTLSSIPFAVGGQSTKTIVPDGKGNFYFINYNSGDTTGFLTLGSVTVPGIAQPSAPSTVTNVWAIDNNADCYSDQGNLTFTEAADDGFSAVETAGKNCSTLPFGSSASFPVSVTFTPTASETGTVTTTLTATNSSSGDTGTASVTGTAAVAQLITAYATSPVITNLTLAYGSGPYTLSATGGASGNPVVFSVDTASTAGVASTSGTNGTTLTITGTGTLIVDANQAGTTTGTIYAPGSLKTTYTVTAAPQTIVYSGPASLAYSTTTVNLGTSTTGGASGQPVTFTFVSGPAGTSVTNSGVLTIGGVTTTSTGPIVIDANQQASTNGDYAAAAQLVISIAVTPAPQTIVFSPTTPVTYSTTPITLSATGGASGNPVTFTIASGPGTLSGTNNATLTITGVGSIVINANQAASTNGNYAVATQVSATIVVNSIGVVATPAISPASGNTLSTGTGGSDTVTITDGTTGAAIYYTTDGSDPLTSATAKLYATGGFTLTTAGSAKVIAVAKLLGYTPSTESTATYTVVSTAPAFTASSSAGTSATSPITITSSTPGTLTLTLTPSSGFDQQITFACTPSTGINVTCGFAPATLTPTGNDAALTTTVTLTKGSGSAALQKLPNPFLPSGATLAALALGFLGWKKRRSMFLALALIVAVIGIAQLTGCGGSSSKTGTVAINATAGGTTVTTTVNVVVK